MSRFLIAAGMVCSVGLSLAIGWIIYRGVQGDGNPSAPEMLLLVSVSPADDQNELKRFADAHSADPARWKLLTGDDAHKAALEKACLTESKQVEHPDPGRRITHTNYVYLIDAKGRIQARYPVAEEIYEGEKATGLFRVNETALDELLGDARRLAKTAQLDRPPLADTLPAFTLVDQNGQTVTRESIQGKVAVVGFFFTCCTASCPRIAEAMAEIQGRTAAPPRKVILPSVNAVLNSCAAVLLAAGYIAIRRRRVRLHAFFMLTAVCVSTVFLASYLYYHFVETGGRPTRYAGPDSLRVYYLCILWSHTILAVLVVPLAGVTLYHAARLSYARHRRVARWTLPIWLYVSVTGVVVYWMLYRL